MSDKRIQYFDSMAGSGLMYLKTLLRYLSDESMDKLQTPLDAASWSLQTCDIATTPQQNNGSDCGMFTIAFADFLADNLPLRFTQADIPEFRVKVCASILRGSLWYWQ
jgi:sentrin-specific protease 1